LLKKVSACKIAAFYKIGGGQAAAERSFVTTLRAVTKKIME
jgi:hypothetical protein